MNINTFNIKLKKYYPLFITLFVFIFVFVLKNIVAFNEIMTWIDNKIQSIMYYDKLKTASDNIVIVEIDERTLSKLGRFPFARKEYIPVLTNLSEKGAMVVGMDIIFSDKTDEENDIALANTFEKVWNVVIWQAIWQNGSPEPVYTLFKDKVLWTGIVAMSDTDIVFSIPLYKELRGKIYKSFSTTILEAYYNYGKWKWDSIYREDNGAYYLNERVKIPLTKVTRSGIVRNELLINYIKPNKFKRYSYIDIYDENSFDAITRGFDFKDKIVIIWPTAKGIKDVFYSPLWLDYGVYVHANAINTVLQGQYLQYFNKGIELAIIFFLVLFFVYFNFTRSWKLLLLTNFTVITILVLFYILLENLLPYDVVNYPGLTLFSLFFSILFTNMARYLTENKDKMKLSESLSQYVSKDIAKEILSWEWIINLDGEEKEITIFFSDIEWFTTISEKYSPTELIEFLREYLSLMTNIIFHKKWSIDKYEWDAIMALWWWFGHKENMQINACTTALLQIKILKWMNSVWRKRWIPNINIRIWLNSGKAILWNIWSVGKKLEYTALWDNVNLASRLEWINKFYGTNICVSQDIVDNTEDKFIFRYLDTIKVKWKNLPVKIYELVWFKWEKVWLNEDDMALYLKAIKLYEVWEFNKAKTIFLKLAKIGDKPSAEYIRRCEDFIQDPPENWNGIWEMSEK